MNGSCIEASVDGRYFGVIIWFYVHKSLTLSKEFCISSPPLASFYLRFATSYSLNQDYKTCPKHCNISRS